MNRFFTIISTIMLSLNLFAASLTEQDVLNIILPEKMKDLKLDVTTKNDIIKKYGKPAKVDKNFEYYEEDGIRYPIAFKYDKNSKLILVSYTYPVSKIKLADLKGYVSQKNFKDTALNEREMGRNFRATKGKIAFDFINNSEISLVGFIWGK